MARERNSEKGAEATGNRHTLPSLRRIVSEAAQSNGGSLTMSQLESIAQNYSITERQMESIIKMCEEKQLIREDDDSDVYEDMEEFDRFDDSIKGDVRLDNQVKAYLYDIGQYEVYSKEEEYEVGLRVMAGDEEAIHDMTMHNLRLVVAIAKTYRYTNVPFMDIVMEGNIGLMKAVTKFDYTMGNRFATYATWWIKQNISRSITNNERTIRMPVYVTDYINKYERKKKLMTQEMGREPTIEEVCKRIDVSAEKMKAWLHVKKQTSSISIDAPLDDDERSTIGSFVGDEKQTPDKAVMRSSLDDALMKAMNGLTENERSVIIMKYGIGGRQPMKLSEIAEVLGCTKERVRQMENKAIKKMSTSENRINLKELYLACSN